MTTEQSAKVDMFVTTNDFLTSNAALVATVPILSTQLAAAISITSQLQQISMLQDETITGSETDKLAARAALTNQAISISGSLTAYATAVNNNVLLNMINFTPSSLKRMSDAKLKEKANILYTQALPIVALLAAYNITVAVLTTFNTAISTFTAAKSKPKTGIALRKQYTSQLASLFKQADIIYAVKMDKLMLLARNTSPVLYTDYVNIRKINNPPSQKIALKIKVLDFDTQKALPGMLFYIENITKPLKSSKKGNCQRKHLPFGVLKAKATKAGYAEQNFTIAITQGQTTRLAIVMKKEPGVITPTFEKTQG
jgi:hypothetical protein